MKRIIGFILMTLALTVPFAAKLETEVFNPGKEAIFPVVSTIIYGKNDAILVDAQFEKKNASKLAELIKQSGKNLKYIYISHSDPDYYFGVDEIKKVFPNAKVISTAQTAYLISATKDAKLQVWKDQLKDEAPTSITIPEAVTSNQLKLDGKIIEIKQDLNDPAHSFLWIPSLRTVLGGISVVGHEHLWMADTPTVGDIDKWIGQIDKMIALKPSKVIPSHFIKSDYSPQILHWNKEYLQNFKTAINQYKNSKDIIAYFEQKYPELDEKSNLEMSAKVFTGEQAWQVASPYPVIGRTAEVNFGTATFDLNFKDNKTMSFIGTSGDFKGVKDTVEYTAVEVAKNVFMVYWHEPNAGANVVHIQDFNTGTVYTNIAGRDNSFVHMKGKISIKK